MIPLILHNRTTNTFNTSFRICAEDWYQNMNARLVYDFILLFVLFIIPLILMTYCYVRISFALWFIDSNIHRTLSSFSTTTNTTRFSVISKDLPQADTDNVRRQISSKNRLIYFHYHKTYENNLKQQQQNLNEDECNSLITASEKNSISNRPVQSTTTNDTKKSLSITPTTTAAIVTTLLTTCRRSSSITTRRFGEHTNANSFLSQNQQRRQTSMRHRRSTTALTSGILPLNLVRLRSRNEIVHNTRLNRKRNNTTATTTTIMNNNNNNNNNRSTMDVQHGSRFLKSRRRVVKLLIALGIVLFCFSFVVNYLSMIRLSVILVIIFFVTRLPFNILSIYIDITSHTYIPETLFTNKSNLEISEDKIDALSSKVRNTDKKMKLVLYVEPVFRFISLSNSALNPLCYCLMSHAVKNIMIFIRRKFRKSERRQALSLPLT